MWIIIIIITAYILLLLGLYYYYKQELVYTLPLSLPIPAYNNRSIPKIIHKTGPKPLEDVEFLFEHIKKLNPGYQIKYYDDFACRQFIQKHFSDKVVKAFDALKPGAYKADLFRYCVLYINGGIYGDLSQEYYVPFDKLIDNQRDILVLVKDKFYFKCYANGIQISFMAAIPKLKVFKMAIKQIIANINKDYFGCSALSPTGPVLFRRCLSQSQIPYRMEYEQSDSTITHIKTGKPIIRTKRSQHDFLINKNNKNNYLEMWRSGKIYIKD